MTAVFSLLISVNHRRSRRDPLSDLREEQVRIGAVTLSLLRPGAPDELIDEAAFARDEFLPYWAELWPAATGLATALPASLDGIRVLELGAAWASRRSSRRRAGQSSPRPTGRATRSSCCEERRAQSARAAGRGARLARPVDEEFDLVLAADVLYEQRNVEPLVTRIRELAPESLIGLAGRPYEAEFLRALGEVEDVAPRVVRFTRAS